MAKGKTRPSVEINASSMADIAFLLLIFFLITTKLDQDKGISVVLPQWTEDSVKIVEVPPHNVFLVLVNSREQRLVENELCPIEQLRRRAIEFIDNNGVDPRLSDSPQEGVVSFKSDRGTSYKRYIEVYNELKAAYNTLRDDYAARMYSKTYALCDSIQRADVKTAYPLRLSEAEPTNFGG